MNRFLTATLAVLAATTLVACDDSTTTEPTMETLTLAFSGLEPLANGFHYEGWAIVAGAPVPTGKFNVGANGGLVTVDGAPIPGGDFDVGIDLSDATAIVLTIEPAGDTDAIPTETHVLAGDLSGGTGALVAGHGAALGDDFLAATGEYILATPTDDAANNEASGIWFLSLETGAPTAGLSLPTLPAGWVYEGWAVIDGMPVTTGRFTSVDGADDAAPYSGPLAGPPFPGEDFLVDAPTGLTFPTDLSGGLAVISIEPQPDDSPAPYTFKPLMGTIAADAAVHTTLGLPNMTTNTFPSGTAAIR